MGGLYPSTGLVVGVLSELKNTLNFPFFSTVAQSNWLKT